MALLEDISKAVLEGDEDAAPKLVEQAMKEGMPPQKVLNEGLLAGMTEVGRLFRDGEYFVPEVLISAETMKAATEVLKPYLADAGIRPELTALIGTVKGDLHDIGKNLVATMLEGAGFAVVDLGVDVSPDKFIEACSAQRIDLVCISALLTTTMPMMEESVKRIREEVQPTPVILVGGAPVTQDYAEKIGAHGYGRDAASGADLAKELCKKSA